MSEVEKELRTATKFKGKQEDRQELLHALARAADKLHQDIYDNLSDEAANWHTEAVSAINKREAIPDFEDIELLDQTSEEPDEDEVDEELAPAEEADDEDGQDEAEPAEDEAEDEAEPEEKPAEKPEKKAKVIAVRAKKPPKVRVDTSRYDNITGEKDRFGVVEGTKTSDAVKMYERGTTAKEIMETLGGRFYNILTRMTNEGHRVEKLEGGRWKLTHKDDLTAEKPKKVAKKKNDK